MVHELALYFPLINFGCLKLVILKCHVAFLEMILKRIFLNSISEYCSLYLMKTSLFLSSGSHQKTFFSSAACFVQFASVWNTVPPLFAFKWHRKF